MAQIPIGNETFSRLNVLKAKAVLEREGYSTTWDNIIATMIDVSNNHSDEFVNIIKNKKGKLRQNGSERET